MPFSVTLPKVFMMSMNKIIIYIYLILFLSISSTFAQQQYIFEEVGKPIRSPLTIEFVTRDKITGPIAWGAFTDAEKNKLIGVNVETGKLTEVDLEMFGKANALLLFKHSDRYIYLYTGKPGRFLKYDVRHGELQSIGEESRALYWMKKSFTVAPDGKIYVGTYPRAAISVLDPATEEVEVIDRISASAGSEYVINPASDMDGIVYFPTGMKHGELWSYNPKTKEKKQILPKKLMTYGAVQVWRAKDGRVYGRRGSTSFLCLEDRIVEGETVPQDTSILDNVYKDKRAVLLNRDGHLVLQDTTSGAELIVQSTFEPTAHEVFSVGDIYRGKLYGSGMKPGHIFAYDLQTQQLEDLGHLTRGRVQTYDILTLDDRLFMSSYTGGYLDVFKVDNDGLPIDPMPVAHLHRSAQQERLVQLVRGPDGNIYSPTAPIKGFLGGALLQVDPQSLQTKVFRDIVPNQSLTSVTAIPETGELFITLSVHGGSSAKPVDKEAVVVLWDPSSEKITFSTKPVRGTRVYGKTVRADNGLIYGSAGDHIYVFDPNKRKVLTTLSPERNGEARASRLVLSESPASDGLLYGVDNSNGRLFQINPYTNTIIILAEHESIRQARFAEVKEDGYMYYPNHSSLMRVRVIK